MSADAQYSNSPPVRVKVKRLYLPDSAKGLTIPSALDLFESRFIMTFSWLYLRCPPEVDMQRALIDVCCRYPESAGYMAHDVDERGRASALFNHMDPFVDFEIYEALNTFEQQFHTDTAEQRANAMSLLKDYTPSPLILSTGETPDHSGNRLLRVRLTKLAQGAALLSIHIHHSVGDAGSCFQWMKEWSDMTRIHATDSLTTLHEFRVSYPDRHALFRRHTDVHPTRCSDQEAYALGWVPDRRHFPFVFTPSVHRIIRITPALAKSLKDYALTGSAGAELRKTTLSTNDVMAAFLTLLFAKSSPHEDGLRYLQVVVDIREKTNELNYFGNFVYHLAIPLSNRSILERSFSEVCLLIRQSLNAIDYPTASKNLAFIQHRYSDHTLEENAHVGAHPIFVFITNWMKFRTSYDFGTGKPSYFLPFSPPIAGFISVYADPEDESIACWSVNFLADAAVLYDTLDLSTPSTFPFQP